MCDLRSARSVAILLDVRVNTGGLELYSLEMKQGRLWSR